MDAIPRHQCLLYEGAPSRQLPAIGELMQEKLRQNFRCLYLNSPVMVAGMRSHLAAIGIDVGAETAKTRLIMSSERHHLHDGRFFDVDQMMDGLKQALDQALSDGFAGLWATGDMTWEFGPERGSMKLLEYEWRLEDFFRSHPQIQGICQYHLDTLPGVDPRDVLLTHPAVFVNQTLSLLNPYAISQDPMVDQARENLELGSFLGRVLGSQAS